ncbi:MAG: hypothetical protein PHW67_03400 [Bacilli bacterium]|nr:hypothetical protein [Bacilli bacterium]MDD3422184.1 hypothetical protein [Bacilli bacterium]
MVPTKDQIELINRVYARYRKSKKMLGLYKQGYTCFFEGEADEDRKAQLKKEQDFVNFVNQVYLLLSTDSRLIIKNDYLLQREDFWWEELYSRSTYYRRRSQALRDFIYYYSI